MFEARWASLRFPNDFLVLGFNVEFSVRWSQKTNEELSADSRTGQKEIMSNLDFVCTPSNIAWISVRTLQITKRFLFTEIFRWPFHSNGSNWSHCLKDQLLYQEAHGGAAVHLLLLRCQVHLARHACPARESCASTDWGKTTPPCYFITQDVSLLCFFEDEWNSSHWCHMGFTEWLTEFLMDDQLELFMLAWTSHPSKHLHLMKTFNIEVRQKPFLTV